MGMDKDFHAGTLTAGYTMKLPVYTLATLPSAAVGGRVISVSDASTPYDLCFSNGTAWIATQTGIAVA